MSSWPKTRWENTAGPRQRSAMAGCICGARRACFASRRLPNELSTTLTRLSRSREDEVVSKFQWRELSQLSLGYRLRVKRGGFEIEEASDADRGFLKFRAPEAVTFRSSSTAAGRKRRVLMHRIRISE